MKKYLHYLIATLSQLLICSFTLGFTGPNYSMSGLDSETELSITHQTATAKDVKAEKRYRRTVKRCCHRFRMNSNQNEIAEPDQYSEAMIRGIILDASGGPVPFSNVALIAGKEIQTGSMADASGVFELPVIQEGKFDLKVSCVGYGPMYVKEVSVTSSGVQSLKIVLHKGLKVQEIICSAERPNCNRICGLGCFCTCCAPGPMGEPMEAETATFLTTVDTLLFSEIESWHYSEIDQPHLQEPSYSSTEILERGVPPEQVAQEY